MSALLIIIGIVERGWAAKANTIPEFKRSIILQGSLGGQIQLVCQLGGLGLLIYGVVKLLSQANHGNFNWNNCRFRRNYLFWKI